jgi:CysZ protein
MNAYLAPMRRALAQLDDPVFLGVVVRSLVWSVLAFVVLLVVAIWSVHHLFALQGWLAWGADLLGGLGAGLLAFWLFFPVAAVIGTLFIERIARAVERRFYPSLPEARGASLAAQMWDGLAVGARILLLNAVALVLAVFLPGVGLLLAWAIGAFAIGRGLFVAVAMRRMSRPEAEALYRRERPVVLAQGAVLALAGYVPILNLLLPMIGTAAMVHVLDRSIALRSMRAGARPEV